ncbi:MAG TPA: hypothetical protein VN879_00525, partial [Candidatus Acidoferrales bacterium]|nr:hypothetical protein [Candidatus Acidoferrales bacterium]
MGFRVSVSLPPAIQATGRLTFAPAGLIPAEHTSLRWTHKRSQSYRLLPDDLIQAESSPTAAMLTKHWTNDGGRQA